MKRFKFPVAEFEHMPVCNECDAREPKRWMLWQSIGERRIYRSVCDACFSWEEALTEAKLHGRRVTEFWLCRDMSCQCGALSLKALNGPQAMCMRCWREWRMLDKEESALRFNRRLIKSIKEQMKNGNEHQDNRATA